MIKNSTLFIGLDLGDTYSVICVLDTEGKLVEESRIPTSQTAFNRKFADFTPCRIAMEVGSHSRWASQLLQELGHEVIVADARKLRLIYQNPRKSDRADAEYLARLARIDPNLLYPVFHRSSHAQADLAIIRARDSLVRARTMLTPCQHRRCGINHVRGITKSFGTRLPSCSAPAFADRVAEHVPPLLQPALSPMLDTLRSLNVQIRSFDRQIESLCRTRYPETMALRAIQGVGPITALAFILTFENPRRFLKSRDVGPALGLVPRRDQSGGRDPQLRITKTGNAYLRRLLVSSAQYILGSYGPDCDLKRWGLMLAERGGKAARKRAVVAVARRLAVLLHRLWVSEHPYDPFFIARSNDPSLPLVADLEAV
jgi:transposase